MRSAVLVVFLFAASCGSFEVEGESSPPEVREASGSLVSPAPSQAIDHASARLLISRQLAREPSGLQRVARRDGALQMRVREGYQHATMVVRAADGTRTQHCVTSAEGARRLLDEAAR